MKKLELKEGVVYHMCEIGIENLSLNSITSNRKDKKQIDDKLKSDGDADSGSHHRFKYC